MTGMKRLVTYADVSDAQSDPETVSIDLRHEVELADGRWLLLLNDRGWGSSGSWSEVSRENIESNSRMCVGPDEPFEGRSRRDMEIEHWAYLQRIANRQGVALDATEFARLPHDVVLSERLLARIGADFPSSSGG